MSINAEKFIIMPFRRSRNRLVAAETRAASSEASATKIAEAMSSRFVGVAAYGVSVDPETGDMGDPRLLMKWGEVPDVDAA